MTQYGLKCRRCGDRIFSNHRHDFVRCECRAIFVDGGFDYFRAGFDPKVGPGIAITRTLKERPKRGYRG